MRCLKSYITEAQIGFTFSGKNNQSKLRSAAESSCLACCEPACVLTHQFVWFVAVWSGVGGRSVNGEAEGPGELRERARHASPHEKNSMVDHSLWGNWIQKEKIRTKTGCFVRNFIHSLLLFRLQNPSLMKN